MPRAKRFKSNDSSTSLSQPAPQIVREIEDNSNFNTDEPKNEFCFSQPTLMEDLILCSQMNPTQSTQNPFHRLVKRMTRFCVITSLGNTINRIIDTISKMGYSWKSTDNTLTVSTVDRRKIQLDFKINIIEMSNNILVDFRLSKGDGIEFKRRFIEIKKSLSDIIAKDQNFW